MNFEKLTQFSVDEDAKFKALVEKSGATAE
jgi:hypothetical protein